MLQSLVRLVEDVHESHSHLVGYGFVSDVNGGPPHLLARERSMQGAPHLHEKKHLSPKSIDTVMNITRHEHATLLCDSFATCKLDLQLIPPLSPNQ